MKKVRSLFFVFASLITTSFVKAQTVDEIIDKYINALGGKEKISSLNTVKITGTINQNGNDLSFVITKKNKVGSRLDFSIVGTENYQIVTPAKGISFMPIRGMTEPTEMTEAEFKSGQTLLDIQSPLLEYKDKGNTVELLGNEKVDNEDSYKLKLTYKNGIILYLFISIKDNRMIKTTGKRTVNGEEMEFETKLSNYKQNADGYWFAYTISSNVQGETNFDKIETNIPVDESIFK